MRSKTPVKRITVQVRNTSALPRRAEATERLLRNLRSIFAKIFGDENFITLLQAESRTTIPEYLRTTLEEAKNRHDIA
jgi:hypothetical protein